MKARLASVAAIAPAPADVLAHLPIAVLVVDAHGRVARANAAAEELLGRSEAVLALHGLPVALGQLALRAADGGVRAHDVALGLVRVDIAIAPIGERPGWLTMTIAPRQPAPPPSPRGAGLALTLAHEIKNPLAGIRGAAQLLEAAADAEGRELTELIRDEVDRVARLVDRLEMLGDARPPPSQPLNVHEILTHVARLTRGFAPAATVVEDYDPSLPAIIGDRDALVQLFLNLAKNAAEATGGTGEIRFATAFRHGQRIGGRALPLEARIADNGPGVPAAISERLFEPFVTTKREGSGIGLALAAKIAAEHEAAIEHVRVRDRTIMRVAFPVARRA